MAGSGSSPITRQEHRAQIAALLTLVNNVAPRRVSEFLGLREIDATGQKGKHLIIKHN